MKIKKTLIGLVSVFSLTTFSSSAVATNFSSTTPIKSYISNSKEDLALVKDIEEIFKSSFLKLKEIFTKYYKSYENDFSSLENYIKNNFTNQKRKLKDFNENDLNEFLKIFKNMLNTLKIDNENFSKIEDGGGYKAIVKDIVRDFIKLIKTNKTFVEKIKKVIFDEVKRIDNKNIAELANLYLTFLENINNNNISENEINNLIENLNIKLSTVIAISIEALNGIINYVEQNTSNKQNFINILKIIFKNMENEEFYKAFN